ncbi:unnamed protein product [Caenorhabditis nigoni]
MDESPSEKLIIIFQFVISTIGLVLNVPHLLILLHNSMRTSSTNSIMIGIAICDLIVLSENVYDRIQGYWFYGSKNPCMNQNNYWCIGYPAIYSEPRFIRAFETTETILETVYWYKLINGVFRIFVSVAYPILTMLLIFEIRKSAKFASKALNSRNYEERHRTCRMILVMSIFFVIASAPAGFLEYLQLFATIEYKSILFLDTFQICLTYFISVLVCLNASLHGIINFTMSSKYRQTVKMCLGLEKQRQGNMVHVSVSKINSHV